jgi:hypothetical protein
MDRRGWFTGRHPRSMAARRRNRVLALAGGRHGFGIVAGVAGLHGGARTTRPDHDGSFPDSSAGQTTFRTFDLPAVSPDGSASRWPPVASPDQQDLRPSPNAAAATPLSIRDPRSLLSVAGRTPDRVFGGRSCTESMPAEGLLSPSPRSSVPPGNWSRDGERWSRSVDAVIACRRPGRTCRSGRHKNETSEWPWFLLDGKHYLYLSLSSKPDLRASTASLDLKRAQTISSKPTPYASGHLLFVRATCHGAAARSPEP